MNPRRVAYWAALLPWILGAGIATAQQPRIKVQFRILDSSYAWAFAQPARRRVAEDSAAAMVSAAVSDRFRFFAFSPGGPDSLGHTLRLELKEKDRAPGGPIDAASLYVALLNGMSETKNEYWTEFRPLQFAMAPVDPAQFLPNLRLKLDALSDADWGKLLTDLLGSIPIADSSAAAWAPPPAGAEPEIEWLIPYVADSVCFDPDRSTLLVRNLIAVPGGTRNLVVTVKPSGSLTLDPAFVLPARLEPFRGRIRAPRDTPTPRITALPDSIKVRAVYVTEYQFDRLNCTPLRQGGLP